MWIIIISLMLFGLFSVYSSTGSLAYKNNKSTEVYLIQQLGLLLVGFTIMLMVHTIPYRIFLKYANISLFAAYLLLILTLAYGKSVNEAKRWLEIPFIRVGIQTSEFAKVALYVFLTRYLALKQDELYDFKKSILPVAMHIFLVCGLIAPNNLSTAIVIFSSSMVILFIGRVSIKHVAYLGIIGISCVALLLIITPILPKKYQLERGMTWVNRIKNFESPFKNNQTEKSDKKEIFKPEQKDYAQIAIAAGGFWGKGPGQSTQKNFIPEGYNDFIYAVINEEYGLWGALIIMLMFMIFMFRALRIILKSPKASGALLAIGLSFSFCVQALIHMGVSTTLLPVTGQTLPFISKGGSSVIMTSIAFGMIMSVSRFVEQEDKTATDGK